MVIVDEFHHAEAPTYARLLDHLQPRVLLGLTATPERTDGGDVRQWFDGRTAVELHLWEALERQLLAPFQYFGLHDDVDLSQLRWKRGQGYDPAELDSVYTGNDARARLVLQAVRDTVDVGADAGARVLREHRARRVHGRRFTKHGVAGGGGDLAASIAPDGRAAARGLREPASCGCSSPSTCSTRASTCRGRHDPVPAADRERHGLPAAARPRPAARTTTSPA